MAFGSHNDLLVTESTSDPHNGRILSIDLQSKKTTVLADALNLNRSVEKRNWYFLKPNAQVAQSANGAIYFTEPGATMFSVLWPQN